MSECVAFECKETGIYFFPKDPRLRVLWENATQIPDFFATDTSRLCPRHFNPTDFDYKVIRDSSRPIVTKMLKTSSIPSIFKSCLKRKRPSKRKESALTVEIEALDDTLEEDNDAEVNNDEEVNNDDEINNDEEINDNNDDEINDVQMSPAQEDQEESADDIDDDDYQPAKDAKDSDDSASNSSGSCHSVPLEPDPAVPMETIWLNEPDNEAEEPVAPSDVAVNVTLDTTSPKKRKNNQTGKNSAIVIKDGDRLLNISFTNNVTFSPETVRCIEKIWKEKFKDLARHVMAEVRHKNKVYFLANDKPIAKNSHVRKDNEIITKTVSNSSQTATLNEIETKTLKNTEAIPADLLQKLAVSKEVLPKNLTLVDASKVPPEILKKLAASSKVGTKELKVVDANSLPPELMQKLKVTFPSVKVSSEGVRLLEKLETQSPKPKIVYSYPMNPPPPSQFPETVNQRQLRGSDPPPPKPLIIHPLEPRVLPQQPKILNVWSGEQQKTYSRRKTEVARLRTPPPVFDDVADVADDVTYVGTTVDAGQPSKPRPTPPAKVAPATATAPANLATPAGFATVQQAMNYVQALEKSYQARLKKLTESIENKKQHVHQNMLLRKRIKSYKNKCDDLRKRLKCKSNLTSAFHLVTKNMTTTAKIFTRMQMEANSKAAKGRRYTTEEKILAMSLYRQNPSVYRLMTSLFTLPSPHKLAELMKADDEGGDDDPAPPPPSPPRHAAPITKPTTPTTKIQKTDPNIKHVKLEDQNQIVLHEEDLIILNEDGEIVLQYGGETLLQGLVQNGKQIYQNLLKEGHKEFQGQLENGVLKLGDLLTAQHIVQEEPQVKIDKKVKIERTYPSSSVFSPHLKW